MLFLVYYLNVSRRGEQEEKVVELEQKEVELEAQLTPIPPVKGRRCLL